MRLAWLSCRQQALLDLQRHRLNCVWARNRHAEESAEHSLFPCSMTFIFCSPGIICLYRKFSTSLF